MNLGFRDVACLRRVLRDARGRGGDIGAAHVLRRYERERRSENTLAARGLDAISTVFGSSNPAVSMARAAGLAAVDRIAFARQLFASVAAGRM
jgi:2-octaprenyl-3-methyl-6-methoxy-1,4-benzoquinol hydroxylase/2-octaprenylphenol hydroxylase